MPRCDCPLFTAPASLNNLSPGAWPVRESGGAFQPRGGREAHLNERTGAEGRSSPPPPSPVPLSVRFTSGVPYLASSSHSENSLVPRTADLSPRPSGTARPHRRHRGLRPSPSGSGARASPRRRRRRPRYPCARSSDPTHSCYSYSVKHGSFHYEEEKQKALSRLHSLLLLPLGVSD